MKLMQFSLPYFHDSAALFACIAHEPWAILLDSAQQINPKTQRPASEFGHYDILVARPMVTLITHGCDTEMTENGETTHSQENPFEIIKKLLNKQRLNGFEMPKNLPFAGGALGYFAYDLGRAHAGLAPKPISQNATPDMMIGIYDWAVVVDHREKTCNLVSLGLYEKTLKIWDGLCQLFAAPAQINQNRCQFLASAQSNLSAEKYAHAFNQIQAYIQAGDCYQVNLAQRFEAPFEGDSWVAYLHLRNISPAPFMAFMRLPLNDVENLAILSASPERFIQVNRSHAETRPIKGTRPRFLDDPKADAISSHALLTSEKDRAENLMIVDLLRNDFGMVCAHGSVAVEKLFQLQSFANVHHLVSIITGKLGDETHACDLLSACFPGGSITGAPKIRAMQIIDELEPDAREVYCGAIGYIGFDGNMDTNIAIRTAVAKQGCLRYYAGGGIVLDSEVAKEYQETFDKVVGFNKIIQQLMRL